MTAAQLVGWLAQIITAVVEVVGEALKASEPPALPDLRARVVAAIDARSASWLKDAEAEADRALVEAAAGEINKVEGPV